MKLKEILNLNENQFKNLTDIKTALLHLRKGEITFSKDYYSLPDSDNGYLEYVTNKSKNSAVVTFDKSHWGAEKTGVVYINGDKTKGYEFATIQSLHDILKKNKIV
jgi:hypothetical protein